MVRYLPSPHADSRPDGVAIDLLVVHAITLPPGEFGGGHVDDFFLGRLDPGRHPFFREIAGMRVSAHFFIDRAGRLTQYVPVAKRAWHAGASLWEGRDACNDFSVGVELEGYDGGGFEAGQYAALATLTRTLQAALPGLTGARIVGHADIAPGRKWDPGPGFDWAGFRARLAATGAAAHSSLVWE